MTSTRWAGCRGPAWGHWSAPRWGEAILHSPGSGETPGRGEGGAELPLPLTLLPVPFPSPQKFLFFVLKSSDVLDILVPILYFLNDARADQCKLGRV